MALLTQQQGWANGISEGVCDSSGETTGDLGDIKDEVAPVTTASSKFSPNKPNEKRNDMGCLRRGAFQQPKGNSGNIVVDLDHFERR